MEDDLSSNNRNKILPMVIGILILAIIGVFSFFGYKYFSKRNANNKEDRSESQVSDKKKFDIFPVRFEDLSVPAKVYGLWPYGVRGRTKDDHNEGHPGWDFELKNGAKVYAIGDLEIFQIHDGDTESAGEKLKVIEAGSLLESGRYHIVYHSVSQLEPNVVEGAKIKAGEPLALAGFPLSSETRMIHFGIFQPHDSVGSCPSDFFSPDALLTLEKVSAISLDTKTSQPFTSACVGKIDRTLYESNYPDRVQYLEGAEPWE